MERDAPAGNGDRQTDSGGLWRFVGRSLRVSRSMAIILLLVASLATNAALFVGGVLYNVIDEALESATGLATATGKQRKAIKELKRKNRQLVVRNSKLREGMTEVRRKNRQLVVRNSKLQHGMTEARRKSSQLVVRNRKLRDGMTEAQRKNSRLVDRNRGLQNRMTKLRTVTNGAVKRTAARSAKAAVRAVATVPGKALPYVGTAVVVGAATAEIKDYCDTIQDMKEIQQEIDPSKSGSDDEPKVCGMKVPTEEEILSRIRTAPLKAWQSSRKFLTDLNPITPEIETKFDRWRKDTENTLHDGWSGLVRMVQSLTK